MTTKRQISLLSRFLLPWSVSILAGPPQSGLTTIALALAREFREHSLQPLYIATERYIPPARTCSWIRHHPRIPFEEIIALCDAYKQKEKPLDVLIVDTWEHVEYGNNLGGYRDLKHAFLRLKLIAIERNLRIILVCRDYRDMNGEKVRPRLLLPFMLHEAKTIIGINDKSPGNRRALIWQSSCRPWDKGLVVPLDSQDYARSLKRRLGTK